MTTPILSVVIPTHNRPQLLVRAVQSALEQTLTNLEVIVVDDASDPPVALPPDPRLRLIRLDRSRGGAGARNVGTAAAQGRWITYLDDDDRLLPHMAAASLSAIERASQPHPIAVISGIEVISPQGQVTETRLPPPLRRLGSYFALEPIEAGRSYNTKQTMVVEKAVIEAIGGWDESFRSRVHSELFLRLNPACSIIGLPTVTYQLYAHPGTRVSQDRTLRQESFRRLIHKHRTAFAARPVMFANFVFDHARTSYKLGQKGAALASFCWALRINPLLTIRRTMTPFWQKVYKYTQYAFRDA